MSKANEKISFPIPNFAATPEALLAFHEFILKQEMEALFYAEEMATAERKKPVDDENLRETIWFERARKMRITAMRFLEKHMKLREKLHKQANEATNLDEVGLQSRTQGSEAKHTPDFSKLEKKLHQTYSAKNTPNPSISEDSDIKVPLVGPEILDLTKRRRVCRDPSVPSKEVWVGPEKNRVGKTHQPKRHAKGGKAFISNDNVMVKLLHERTVFRHFDIPPGEIWIAMDATVEYPFRG